MRKYRPSVAAAILLAAALPATAQLPPAADWAARVATEYQITSNVTYLTASNYDSKLDVYARRGATTPQPTVVYFHGGFWAAGAKENSLMSLVPWLEMGWNVVNVEYRLARVAPAPAAVEDALCALRFLATQAGTYHIDVARLVVTGESAGGHLTLMSAMTPESAGLDRQCAGNAPVPRVAGAINWYGITDVADVIDGPHKANLAVTWFGSLPNKDEVAKRVSPLTYVRADLPPILTIHGDKDPLVPYDEATRLHAALKKAGAPNELLTVPGGGHGGFTPEERVRIFTRIRAWLGEHGLPAENP
ncbi:MAG: alpha/beta hydrolase [Gammaproteobacteria bacterium]